MSIKLSRTVAAAMTLAALTGAATADQVIPDDLIVQGSLCVGFDCVNNESFGSDTIILKENQLRILFLDTSASGFPSNDWRLIANDATGTGNLFAIEDATAGRRIMTLSAGASTNSIFVDSTGRVGFRTATPVLDLHVNTSNTPAIRLEQNNSGGFTAQTWDIGANEANFFVRDVTTGSKLPFRIRPGAPTSSLDISASGNVGIGTGSPQNKLHVFSAANADISATFGNAFVANTDGFNVGYGGASFGAGSGFLNAHSATGAAGRLLFLTDTSTRMVIDNAGNVGVGTAAPSTRLHTTGGVRFQNVSGCGAGIQSDGSGNLSCIVSSRQFKTVTGNLPPDIALANVMALRPQTGSYKDTPDVPEHWFIAEEVGAIDPALIGLADGKPYVVKTQNVVADLVAVVQQQQHEIGELKRLLNAK